MLERELKVAIELARRAGAAIESIRMRGFASDTKSDKSPVTEADLASDRILREGIERVFPEDALLSEESENRAGTSGRTWIIDPLDGTRGFINDVEGYAVQIGLVEAGVALLGVVYEPKHDRLYRAVRKQGAFIEEANVTRALSVSTHQHFSAMTMVASTSLAPDIRQRLVGDLGLASAVPMRSVGAKVGAIVRCQADIYVSSHTVKYWDSCAPLVILEEAGGTWTLLDGRPLSFDAIGGIPVHKGPFVVSNGPRHRETCTAVSQLVPH